MEKKFFDFKLYKDQWIFKSNSFAFKNLNVLTENRNLNDIIIVDNLVSNYSLFMWNGIPILDYNGSNNDF